MNSDLIAMIGRLAQSFLSVQKLITAFAYVLGLWLIFVSLQKYRSLAEERSGGGHGKVLSATMYFVGGAALLFLPTIVPFFANTTFGLGNVLEYGKFNPINIISSMTLIIRTVGVIWFVRGCVLLIHASEPGSQMGRKGIMFLFAGILAINFESTQRYVTWLTDHIVAFTMNAPGL